MSEIYHNPIEFNAIADDDTFNAPLSQLDLAINDHWTFTSAHQAEIVAARGGQISLDARLDIIEDISIVAGGNVVTTANGAAAAAQKTITVVSTSGFVAGASVEYLLNGTTLEYNTIDVVTDAIHLLLDNNIGTGGILDGGLVALISTGIPMAANAIPHGSTDLTLPQSMAYANHGVYNVAAYGASPSAPAAVNVAAIQAAIDDADEPGATVIIPAGVYSIDSTISLVNRSGVRLVGQGVSNQYTAGTKLLWTGAAAGVMLDMSGTNYCYVSNIGFYANASAAGTETNCTAIYAAGNPTFNGSFFNSIEYCSFQNFSIAVELGVASDQVDSWTFDKCWIYHGTAGTGVKINSFNCLNITLSHCTIVAVVALAGGETSKAVHLVDGNVKLIGCITAANKYVIYSEDLSGNLGITHHHTEQDGTFLYTTAAGNHQKANAVVITDLFAYDPIDQLFYLANANWQYVVNGGFVVGNTTLYVPDDPQEVFLNQFTVTGTFDIKNISGVAVNVYGWYGIQTVTARGLRQPFFIDPVIGSGGTAIVKHLSTAYSWNPGSLADGASEVVDLTIVGAAVADVVTVGIRMMVGGVDEVGAWQISGRVRTANIVSVTITNHTGATKNLDDTTIRADVWKH